jgi:tetratricopeptide (TPR) repeat protein
LEDQGRLPIVIHNQATLAQAKGEWGAAHTFYRKAMQVFDDTNDLAGYSTGYHNMGTLAHYEGDYEMAANFYFEADEYYKELHDPIGRAGISANLGVLPGAGPDYTTARDNLLRAWESFGYVGDQLSCAAVASSLGYIEREQSNLSTAVMWNLFALGIRSRRELAESLIDVEALHLDRRMLGDREFRTILKEYISEADAGQLNSTIDAWGI